MTSILLALATLPILVAVHDLARRRDIRRQAVRNIWRHRGEAVLILAGTLLGTAIITASFVVGDSLTGSIRGLATTELGEIDEVVGVEADLAPRAISALTVAPIPGVDGVLAVESAPAVLVSGETGAPGSAPRGEPRGRLYGVDVDAATSFGSDPSSTGFAGAATPGPGQAIVNADVAETLGVTAGDTITAHVFGQRLDLEVIQVIDAVGLAGRGNPVFVAPSTLRAAAAGSDSRPHTQIYISNLGGVFDGAESTASVIDEVATRLAGAGLSGLDISPRKAELLSDADAEGDELTTLFAGIGSFAVIAGVLLLINLFTMLAEERRTDLGVMRALGTKRNVVVRQLALEGTMYAVVAAVLGAIVGMGVGWVIMQFAESLLEGDGLTLAFGAERSSLVLGASIGVVISLATVWITSARISRLNIIRAIRRLPEPETSRTRRRGIVLGLLGVAVGGALFSLGASGGSDLAAIAGPPVAALGAVAFVPAGGSSRRRARKIAVTLASLGSMTWGIVVFTVLPDATANAGISAFVVQGLVLVGGAVALVTTHDRVWSRLLPDRVSVRLGLANPLANRGRTGLVVSMYSLVIFMITFMAVFAAVYTRQADDLAAGISGGHDLIVDSSAANPVTDDVLLDIDGVEAVAVVTRGWADFEGSWSDARWDSWVAGVGPEFFANGTIDVIDRAPEYATDEDALLAIFSDPAVIVVSEFFLVDGDGPGGARPSAGDEVVAVHPDTGRRRTYTVAAVTTSDWIFTGPLVSVNALRDLASGNVEPTRAYVKLEAPDLADDLSAQIDARFVANGAESRSFVAEVEAELAETDGFIRILSGYLGLGLVIGIAGLGVVMVRAVRERRREIGMLRAMGIPAATVRTAFLVEAGFIGFLGASIGTGLGLLTGYQVVTNSTLFGDVDVAFVTPWTMVAIVFIGPWLASLAATAIPAARAAAIRPAAALRMTG